MIIPIRCFTCGKPIAHLWEQYQKKIQDEDLKKSTEGKILDDLKLKRQCCRRIMLTHVDLCKKI